MSQEQDRYLALSRVDTALRTWLAQLSPSVELHDAAQETHKLAKGDTCVEAVRQLPVMPGAERTGKLAELDDRILALDVEPQQVVLGQGESADGCF